MKDPIVRRGRFIGGAASKILFFNHIHKFSNRSGKPVTDLLQKLTWQLPTASVPYNRQWVFFVEIASYQ